MKKNIAIRVMMLMFSIPCFNGLAQPSPNNKQIDDFCTITTAIYLPVSLTTNSVSCAAIVEAYPLGIIGCGNIVKILADPINWWEGTANKCKVIIKKVRDRNSIKTSVEISGKKEDVEKLSDALKATDKKSRQ